MTFKESRAEKMQGLMKQLEEGVASVYTSDEYKAYLRFVANFYDYSANNCILIEMQCPQASFVAGYKTWQKMGRYVKKGEKAIKIIAPSLKKKTTLTDGEESETMILSGFRAVNVFDVSQTDGEDIPEHYVHRLADNDEMKNFDVEAIRKTLLDISPADKIMFSADFDDDCLGCYNRVDNIIRIKEGLSNSETVSAMVHEVAHSILHRKGGDEEKASRNARELQAESIAFIVCEFLGIDTSNRTFGYVAGWAKDKTGEQLKENLNVIQKTAKKIIEKLSVNKKNT